MVQGWSGHLRGQFQGVIGSIVKITNFIIIIFFKVLQDARISVRGELGGQGVSLTISGLRRSDAGQQRMRKYFDQLFFKVVISFI